jgi:hypothetical protein
VRTDEAQKKKKLFFLRLEVIERNERREKNIELLLKNGGSIVQTVQDLLSTM